MKGMFGKGGAPDMNEPGAMETAAKQLGSMSSGGANPFGAGTNPFGGGGSALPPGLSGFGKKK
jgi:signal recognition particle subunit SRP54